jgi:hypothetical protein
MPKEIEALRDSILTYPGQLWHRNWASAAPAKPYEDKKQVLD